MKRRIDIEESKLSRQQRLLSELDTKDHQEYNHVRVIALAFIQVFSNRSPDCEFEFRSPLERSGGSDLLIAFD